MAIENGWVFTDTIFKHEEFLNNTGNVFKLVSQKPYISKKNPEDKGVNVSLSILKDITDYGHDKTTGRKREDNTLNSFDVTILNDKQYLDLSKGDYVRLVDFIPEKSFVIGFDFILRFKGIEKVNVSKK